MKFDIGNFVDMEWEEARQIKQQITHIVKTLKLSHIDPSRIFCYRTSGSTSRSYARIWSFPKIFQRALGIQAAYVIEVLSKYFDKLDSEEQKKVLIHELLHIPKNFSGSLLPHRSRGRRLSTLVNKLHKEYKSKQKNPKHEIRNSKQFQMNNSCYVPRHSGKFCIAERIQNQILDKPE